MADGKKEEKRSIRDSAKSLKKYGSTCNHFKRQDHFVKHAVVEGETLQGIALKYGVTVSIQHIFVEPCQNFILCVYIINSCAV
jgi:hypothetical protein